MEQPFFEIPVLKLGAQYVINNSKDFDAVILVKEMVKTIDVLQQENLKLTQQVEELRSRVSLPSN